MGNRGLKGKSPSKAGLPVPAPRSLVMMEGAQSGANAVAIEMPPEIEQGFHGAAGNKEEEIAASGGASSTSASEETGEVLSGGSSVASAHTVSSRVAAGPVTLMELAKGHKIRNSEVILKKTTQSKSEVKTKKSSSECKKTDSCGGARPKTTDKKMKKK